MIIILFRNCSWTQVLGKIRNSNRSKDSHVLKWKDSCHSSLHLKTHNDPNLWAHFIRLKVNCYVWSTSDLRLSSCLWLDLNVKFIAMIHTNSEITNPFYLEESTIIQIDGSNSVHTFSESYGAPLYISLHPFSFKLTIQMVSSCASCVFSF